MSEKKKKKQLSLPPALIILFIVLAFIVVLTWFVPVSTVTVNDAGVKQASADTELVYYTINSGWTELGSGEKDTVSGTILHRYVYGTDQKCTALSANVVTPTLFDNITVANVIEDQALETTVQNIKVEAYGIQSNDIGADDKTTPSDVWKVIVNQAPSKDKTGENTKTDVVGG